MFRDIFGLVTALFYQISFMKGSTKTKAPYLNVNRVLLTMLQLASLRVQVEPDALFYCGDSSSVWVGTQPNPRLTTLLHVCFQTVEQLHALAHRSVLECDSFLQDHTREECETVDNVQ